jgi:hypothetical protein
VGLISYGIGGLVVVHVGRRLLFGRSPRRCAMPRHNGNLHFFFLKKKDNAEEQRVEIVQRGTR